MAELTDEASVHAIDIARRLVHDARSNIASAGYPGVLVDCRDGARGLSEYAPYDRILLEAAAVEPPRALLEQLAPGGRLVMPLGGARQDLVAIEDGDRVDDYGTVAFHPMLIDGEQSDSVERNRTRREDREHARRAAERRKGWEQTWIDWDRV
jgi:protein-L-isoaspartate(D-aspartate) O-methyltransferase